MDIRREKKEEDWSSLTEDISADGTSRGRVLRGHILEILRGKRSLEHDTSVARPATGATKLGFSRVGLGEVNTLAVRARAEAVALLEADLVRERSVVREGAWIREPCVDAIAAQECRFGDKCCRGGSDVVASGADVRRAGLRVVGW